MIENENKEELFISEHPKSFLELVSTDWRPVVEIEFTKPRGKDVKPNQIIDLEDFISVKGIKALGNQLTSDKVKNINALEPLPFEEPKKNEASEIEVVDEENIEAGEEQKADSPKTETGDQRSKIGKNPEKGDDEAQTTLF
jgi:topoisomerase-4 subunit A